MTISNDDLGRITQQTSVIASDGDRLGTINQIYTSDTTGEPAWVTLRTGLFGSQESFVPLADAAFDGDDIRVPVSKQAVHDAPRVDADGHLSVDEEDGLYRHYGLDNPGAADQDTPVGETPVAETPVTGSDRDDELAQRDVEGRDEVAAQPDAAPRRAAEDDDDDRSVHAEDGAEPATAGSDEQEAVKPGERTTRLRRYVVTERVVQTIEELPDEPSR